MVPTSQGAFQESKCKVLCSVPGTDEMLRECRAEGRMHSTATDCGTPVSQLHTEALAIPLC